MSTVITRASLSVLSGVILNDIQDIILQYAKPYICLVVSTPGRLIHVSESRINQDAAIPIPWVVHDLDALEHYKLPRSPRYMGYTADNRLVIQCSGVAYSINLQHVLSKGKTKVKRKEYQVEYLASSNPMNVTLADGVRTTLHDLDPGFIIRDDYQPLTLVDANTGYTYALGGVDDGTHLPYSTIVVNTLGPGLGLHRVFLPDKTFVYDGVIVPNWRGIFMHAARYTTSDYGPITTGPVRSSIGFSWSKHEQFHLFYSFDTNTVTRCESTIALVSEIAILMLGDTLIIQHWINAATPQASTNGYIQSLDTSIKGTLDMMFDGGPINWRPVNLPRGVPPPSSCTLSTIKLI